MSAALDAVGLTVTRDGRAILDRFSLSLQEGEILAIIGPNGSGKSTALRVMAGVLEPDSGSVSYRGSALSTLSRSARAGMLAYLPQEFRCQWNLTVGDLVALGRRRGTPFGIWPMDLGPAPPLPPDLAHELDIADLVGRSYHSLSGGEKARAAIASTIAAAPHILLADEPAASLDAAHQLSLMGLVRRLSTRMAAIVVLHDLNLASRFADRIALMHRGRCEALGSPAEVLGSPSLDNVFGTQFRRLSVDGRLIVIPA